jgi:oligopeptide transport system substrate-binding protein
MRMWPYTENDSKVGFGLRWLCSTFFVFTHALCSYNGRSLQTKNLSSCLAKSPTFESFSVYLSVVIGMLLSSCDKPREYWPEKQELRMNIKTEPLSLDPRKPNDVTSINFQKMCFDGLTRIGLDGKAYPSIASHIAISEDKKIYTCILRETFWSDGTPLTAYDFEKTWKTSLKPEFPCEAATDLYVIKNARAAKIDKCSIDAVGVKALDAHTLEIELAHPIPSFPSMLSTHIFYAAPSHIVDTHPEWADKKGPYYVCNGPFCLKEWRQSDYMLLEKNPKYWDRDNVKLDRMVLFLIEDETTELSMFENGDLDWAGSPLSSLPTDALHTLPHVTTYSMAGIYYYTINTKDPLLKNANLRKALALAINRKEIIDNVTQSGQLPAMSFIPPALCPVQKYFKDADTKDAVKYFQMALKELGLSKEQFPALTLSYNTMNAHHKIAQAIQGQWRDVLGLKTRLENKEWKVYLDELRGTKYQIGRLGGIANNYEPISFLDRFRYLSSDENFSKWTNAEFTELLERGDAAIDPEERLCYLLKAEAIFMNEMPVIPIYFYTGSYLKKPYVKDVYLSELADVDFKWAYVEMKR